MRHSHCRLSCRLALHLLRACPPIADSFSDAIFPQSPCPCPCPPFTREESTVRVMLWMTGKPSHCRQNVDGGRDFAKSNVSVECSAAQCGAASLTVSCGGTAELQAYPRQLRRCTRDRANANDALSEDPSHYIQSNLALENTRRSVDRRCASFPRKFSGVDSSATKPCRM